MLLGITGGIGSGKSTVCELFTELGAQVYNSDLRASEIMNADGASGNAIRRKIVNLLGAESCKNGMIDTRVVASKVFANS